MAVKQLSALLENKQGSLAALTEILRAEELRIRAFSTQEAGKRGILRMIVDCPEAACTLLTAAGYDVALTEVAAVALHDAVGGLSDLLVVLAANDIDVEYVYAFLAEDRPQPCAILRLQELEKAHRVLRANGFELLRETEVYKL